MSIIEKYLDEQRRKKDKLKEAREDKEIAEKLGREGKSTHELFLEKHYRRLELARAEEVAKRIQRSSEMSMISTKMPKSDNKLGKMKLKLCSSGVRL